MDKFTASFFEVRPCRPEHWRELAARGLRRADRDEAERLLGIPAELALKLSVESSDLAVAVLVNGKACGVFGVGCASLVPYTGAPWLVGHADLELPGVRLPLARTLRRFVRHWLRHYGRLENLADPRNAAAVRLLSWLGFSFDKQAPVKTGSGHFFVRFRQSAPVDTQQVPGGMPESGNTSSTARLKTCAISFL